MIVQIADITSVCQFGVTGKHLALHKQGEVVSLRFAEQMVAGKALLLCPTAEQAAFCCKVPSPALQNALTTKGLRKTRAPKPAPDASPSDAEVALEHALNVLGPDAVFDKALARVAAAGSAPVTQTNGSVGDANGTAAPHP